MGGRSSPGEQARANVGVIQAVYESVRSGRPVVPADWLAVIGSRSSGVQHASATGRSGRGMASAVVVT